MHSNATFGMPVSLFCLGRRLFFCLRIQHQMRLICMITNNVIAVASANQNSESSGQIIPTQGHSNKNRKAQNLSGSVLNIVIHVLLYGVYNE